MAGRRIGVAVLGAGFIAGYHLAGLAATGRADLRAVVGRGSARAADLAHRYGVPEATADLDATLARRDVEAVVVATPDDTHEAVALAATRAGKAILLQKPMAASVEAAERIVAVADRAGVDLQVSFMHRFFDEVVVARRLLREAAIGRVLSARVRNATPGPDWDDWFFRADHVPHGVASQLGVHGIDLVEQLLGRIRRASARARTARPRRRLADGREVRVENADHVSATYELDDGTLVTHEMSQVEVAGCDRFRLEICGEHGVLWLRTERGRLAVGRAGPGGGTWQAESIDEAPMGRRQHDAWLAGVAGDAPPLDTAADALRGMRVVEAVMRSHARGGAAVEVADVVGTGA
jgi:predicted dehydrogenase